MKKLIAFLILIGFFFGCSSNNGTETPQVDSQPEETPVQNIDKSGNLLSTGASANDLLSNTNFDKMVVEIAHVAGFQPTTQTINNFQEFIKLHSFKEDIEITLKELESPNEETLTLNEIDDLEQANRTAYNDGTTIALYIYFADAPSDDDDEEEGLVTLGAVYRNTSMVIYESTIRDLVSNSNIITLTDVETATLNHEFGHLFGLVNLGTEAINNHEDSEAPNHCNVEGCLMQAELVFGSPSSRSLVAKNEGVTSPCTLNRASMLKR